MVETRAKLFFRVWEHACYGGFLTGREAARYMVPRGRNTIPFMGATASVRVLIGLGLTNAVTRFGADLEAARK